MIIFKNREISLEIGRQGDCLQNRESPCQKGRVDSSAITCQNFERQKKIVLDTLTQIVEKKIKTADQGCEYQSAFHQQGAGLIPSPEAVLPPSEALDPPLK